jgi:hypothetical protein
MGIGARSVGFAASGLQYSCPARLVELLAGATHPGLLLEPYVQDCSRVVFDLGIRDVYLKGVMEGGRFSRRTGSEPMFALSFFAFRRAPTSICPSLVSAMPFDGCKVQGLEATRCPLSGEGVLDAGGVDIRWGAAGAAG